MAILYFTDVLRKVGLDPKDVKLIRHALSDDTFRECYLAGKTQEYTQHQVTNFSKDYRYWIVFISDGGTYARLHSCYKVNGSVPDTPDMASADLPQCKKDEFKGEDAFFDLTPLYLLEEYEGKLVIDWGGATRMWHQKATTEKPIVAIEPKTQVPFPGFENLILSYKELEEVIGNTTDYDLWHAAMSSVNAVYLIVDVETGERYVGSTYNSHGLLGRWSDYVSTKGTGGNKGIIEHLRISKNRRENLQFSVLQVLSKSLTNNQIVECETLWKRKLQTYAPHGLNQN